MSEPQKILSKAELKSFLDHKAAQYEHPDFIATDPIQVPHSLEKKEDIEIIGFLTATIAWGNRKSIIANAQRLLDMMEGSPHEFLMAHNAFSFEGFVHRTFNSTDLNYFLGALKELYAGQEGLEGLFSGEKDLQVGIHKAKKHFFALPGPVRCQKHFSDPAKGSAAKRINMFLRWMVRSNARGVDFGLWNRIQPSQLSCPLDVHTGNVARKLGLLQRKSHDAKALQELDAALRAMDPDDPVKYDFALFGLGAFEKFA